MGDAIPDGSSAKAIVLTLALIGAAGAIGVGEAVQPSAPVSPSESGATLLPFDATERTLPNGLKVITVATGFPNLVSLQIPVQTGSRNEIEPGKSGFAHFFEHMMFRGTARYPARAYQDILTRAGANQNAYTSLDYTNYHATFAKEDLAQILEVEADRFLNLAYSEEVFKTEARAVLGEYNKDSANPQSKLFETVLQHAFSRHPYRHTTMGLLEDIEDMPNQFEYSKTFFERWYRPEYTTLIIAGDVTAGEVMPLVERFWGGWTPGTYKADIPLEPAPQGPVRAHVTWPSPTLPWVTLAFRGPAFSDREPDFAALDILLKLTFGETSPLHKRLVVDEQKVDQIEIFNPPSADPFIVAVMARLKQPEDAPYVRDAILRAIADVRSASPSAQRLEDAKANARYSLLRSLDDTQSIAGTLARYVRFTRSFDTVNNFFRVSSALQPSDLEAAARKYLTDEGLVQTTLSATPLPVAIEAIPSIGSVLPRPAATISPIVQRSALPQLNVKLLFKAGSAHDPEGKEGLARLAASMVARAGSRAMRIEEIETALFPIAGSFTAQVDREMTVFTARVHRDNWERFSAAVWPMLTDPGFREEDFERLRANQRNQLVQDLRSNNEEELGRERLQERVFAGTAYAHPPLGTEKGLEAITLDDVKAFVRRAYTRASVEVGLAGDVPPDLVSSLTRELEKLPEGPALVPPRGIVGRRSKGITLDLIEKDTRATAISFGHPIEVTRSHQDFVALSVARSWLGEHRSSSAHLFQRIREARGMNYGDYAYIEAFPGGMFRTMPDPNVGRRAQLFEVWIRPVVPQNAHMALRIAIYELRKLVEHGLSREDFEATRNYLMKNVFLLTANQDDQLGYALDARWYGLGEFTAFMRERLRRLTVEEVNEATRRHLSGHDLHVVVITRDAAGLRERLVSDAVSTVSYDAPKPREILDEDKVIGSLKLNIAPGAATITRVEDVFRE